MSLRHRLREVENRCNCSFEKEEKINHESVIKKAKIRKVLSFYEVPSMSRCLWSRMLLLAFEIGWTGTNPQFSSSHNP